jgi:hypothetical protein
VNKWGNFLLEENKYKFKLKLLSSDVQNLFSRLVRSIQLKKKKKKKKRKKKEEVKVSKIKEIWWRKQVFS